MEQTVNRKIMLIILAAGVFGILNTEMGFIGILPYIAEHYHVSIVQAGWLISLFALGVAAAGPAMPLFMSRFNRRNVMVFILGLFTLCSAAAVFTDNFYVLLVLRVLPAFFHPVYCAMAFTV
ncbi:MAG: MFS transporter, partial [Schwartzia sp.]|nr:MFS transporter [Schwartzia sp. (in: firmicutes)]